MVCWNFERRTVICRDLIEHKRGISLPLGGQVFDLLDSLLKYLDHAVILSRRFWMVDGAERSPYSHSRTSTKCPSSAAAAAMIGDTKCVRPL